MDPILNVVFGLVILLCPCFAEQMHCLEVSKACFGSERICTYHNLRCSSGRIAIQEAFYTENTACGNGVSDCRDINVSSIQLTGTRYNFNKKELNLLNVNCSTQSTCRLQAGRRMTNTFSAIIYECINASDYHNITCNETTTTGATAATTSLKTTSPKASVTTGTHGTTQIPTSSGPLTVNPPRKPTTGTVLGIIIPICIVIGGVVTAGLIFRRRKIRQKGENGTIAKLKSNPREVQSLEEKSSPDYDYTTINGHLELVPNMQAPLKSSSGPDYANSGDQKANRDHLSSRNTRDSEHIGRQPGRENGHYDTTVSVARILIGGKAKQEVYSYNHLNEKVSSNADVDSTYNTTASTRHNLDASINDMEDHCGYNHLGTDIESKKNLPQNEYDTTASAIRDFARMNGDMEESTYDHAHLIISGCSSSGMTNSGFQESVYNHASPLNMVNKDAYKFNASPNGNPQEDGGTDVYTLAREVEANPYQLAK